MDKLKFDKHSMQILSAPNFEGLIDKDILDRFKDVPVLYGDIINAQLIKTNKELIGKLQGIIDG